MFQTSSVRLQVVLLFPLDWTFASCTAQAHHVPDLPTMKGHESSGNRCPVGIIVLLIVRRRVQGRRDCCCSLLYDTTSLRITPALFGPCLGYAPPSHASGGGPRRSPRLSAAVALLGCRVPCCSPCRRASPTGCRSLPCPCCCWCCCRWVCVRCYDGNRRAAALRQSAALGQPPPWPLAPTVPGPAPTPRKSLQAVSSPWNATSTAPFSPHLTADGPETVSGPHSALPAAPPIPRCRRMETQRPQ